MVFKESRNVIRARKHARVRAKVNGTASCPRLCVFRSNKNIEAQVIDDVNGVTLAYASSVSLKLALGSNMEAAASVGKAVAEVKQGKIDFKVDKYGIVHTSIGKVSFTPEKIEQNARAFLDTIIKLKPSTAKGTYVKSVFLSSTMSPGIKIDTKTRELV